MNGSDLLAMKNETKTTVWKAQLAVGGAPQVLIYEADVPPDERSTILLPATEQIRKDVFGNCFIRVFFEGHVDQGGVLQVDKFVRQDQWLDSGGIR